MTTLKWKYYEILKDKKVIKTIFAPNISYAESIAMIYSRNHSLLYFERGHRKRFFSELKTRLSKDQSFRELDTTPFC
jgi:hypothetical protein